MTPTRTALTGPSPGAPPRRIPRRVHALQAVLLAALCTLILGLIVVPSPLHLVLLFCLIAAAAGVGIRAQLRCWGTMSAPAFLPSRLALGAFILVTMYLLSMLPDTAGLLWRSTVALLVPAGFYALMRWDDARTVDLLRERSAKESPSVGTVSP